MQRRSPMMRYSDAYRRARAMIELVRRAAIVVLWIWIALCVIVGELARPARRPLTSSKARGWQTYGDALQFNKAESRHAAETITRYEQAIKVLEAMLWKVKEAAE